MCTELEFVGVDLFPAQCAGDWQLLGCGTFIPLEKPEFKASACWRGGRNVLVRGKLKERRGRPVDANLLTARIVGSGHPERYSAKSCFETAAFASYGFDQFRPLNASSRLNGQ